MDNLYSNLHWWHPYRNEMVESCCSTFRMSLPRHSMCYVAALAVN
jgi:hypothetical protein